MPVDELVRRFIDCDLPESAFTHEAHVCVGLWHLLECSPAEALVLLRERIRRFNVSVGKQNSDYSGYHETITRFHVIQIADFLATRDRDRPVDELADELLAEQGDRDLPLAHYSQARLESVEARRGWVEPDLAPLPEIPLEAGES